MNRRLWLVVLPGLLALLAVCLGGCAVPGNLEGKGKKLHRQCRGPGGKGYWLYVPENYNSERRYPLVVTLHGMKPYDKSFDHVRMWGALADKHRLIVLAPELDTSDSLGQFPLRKMGEPENRDAQGVLAAMDEVMTDWEVDRNSVLLSSWSMGGYLAHYLASECGDRFTAFAPLQSNFCADPLNAANASKFARRLPMFVFYGTGDIAVVTNESKASVEWWRGRGATVQVNTESIGHERHPELAAQFFESILAQRRKNVEIVVTPPGTEPAPLAVNLWPALSSKIGEIRTYVWDFGRLGGPSYRKSPNVLIREPGEYPISLTVIDKNNQRHTASTVLKVPAAKPQHAAGGYPR